MSKGGKSQPARGRSRTPIFLLIVIVVIAGIALTVYLTRSAAQPTPTPAPIDSVLAVRSVSECRQQPEFAADIGATSNTLVGTDLRGYVGLVLADPGNADQPGWVYQDPSWDDAGYLGAYTLDAQGNIFVAPAPLTSLDLNPPAEQNKIYKVDTKTGVMSEYIDLPAAQPPSEFNPFGVLGLGYDCETNSLYATSVSGSAPTEEVGRIYRIDLETGQLADQIDGVDAMGVGVAIPPDGKRLYYGLARNSEVRSLPLAANGDFDGPPRTEFALAALPGGSNERAQRITFDNQGVMRVKGIDFTFSLQVSGQDTGNIYRLRYDPGEQKWAVIDVTPHELPGQ